MTSQAPCRCAENILINYDENKAKADIPPHSLNYIYIYIYIYRKRDMYLNKRK